jgi:hypothetical protein
MKTNRMNIGKITGKIPIRIIRTWHGSMPVGTALKAPGAMRQVLMQAKDPLGNKIAEVYEEDLTLSEDELLDQAAAMANEDFREED